jgi:hypothetical protein
MEKVPADGKWYNARLVNQQYLLEDGIERTAVIAIPEEYRDANWCMVCGNENLPTVVAVVAPECEAWPFCDAHCPELAEED